MSVLLALLLQDPAPVRITYDDTLRFGAADGSFEGQVGGFIRVHGRAIHDRPDDEALPVRVLPDSLYLRQARIETAGTYARDWGYRLSVDFRTAAPPPPRSGARSRRPRGSPGSASRTPSNPCSPGPGTAMA